VLVGLGVLSVGLVAVRRTALIEYDGCSLGVDGWPLVADGGWSVEGVGGALAVVGWSLVVVLSCWFEERYKS
jgi:hypothetical protein